MRVILEVTGRRRKRRQERGIATDIGESEENIQLKWRRKLVIVVKYGISCKVLNSLEVLRLL